MKTHWSSLFLRAAGAVILAHALSLFAIAAGNAPALSLPEPVLGIPLRYADIGLGSIELVVALVCCFSNTRMALVSVVWLATNLVAYQIGTVVMHVSPQFTCTGLQTNPLKIPSSISYPLFEFGPASVALIGCGCLIRQWTRKKSKSTESHKIACPQCGGRIRFDAQNLGQTIACPHCQRQVALRKDENIKMACVFCKEHIAFPSHALGQRISCPHCNKNITLLEPHELQTEAN